MARPGGALGHHRGMYRSSPELPPLVVIAFNGSVVALRTADGGEEWRRQVGGPTVRIEVTAGRVIAAGSSQLDILDYLSGAVVGSIPLSGPTTTLLVAGERAFVTRTGGMMCVDLQAGRVVWNKQVTGTGRAAPAIGVPGATVQGDRAS